MMITGTLERRLWRRGARRRDAACPAAGTAALQLLHDAAEDEGVVVAAGPELSEGERAGGGAVGELVVGVADVVAALGERRGADAAAQREEALEIAVGDVQRVADVVADRVPLADHHLVVGVG